MNFSFGSFSLLLLVALVSIVLYDPDSDPNDLSAKFSYNLKKWHSKGNYFMYKEQHKIFYVYEEYENKKTNEKQKEIDDEDINSQITIVFLHGFPTASYDFYRLWNLFSSSYGELKELNQYKRISLLAFDYLGYGFSDKPLNYDYSIFDMADMSERLLIHLNVKSVMLIAHDVGDTVAQEMLRRDNLKNQNHFSIQKVILLNGGIINGIYKPMLSQHLLLNKYLGNLFGKYFFKFFFFKHSFSQVFGSYIKPNSTDMYDFFLSIKYNNGNQVLYKTINYMNERTEYGSIWYDALNETTRPTMFIYGPADPINPRDTFPQNLIQDIPRIKLRVLSDPIGHYPQYEDSFTVFSLIKQFFSV